MKIRCAKMLTKAHHPTSLTEGQDARTRHKHRTARARQPGHRARAPSVRATRTPCYKMLRLQNATTNRALLKHRTPPAHPLACHGVLGALAFRLSPRAPRRTIPRRVLQNKATGHPVPPATICPNPPQPAQTRHHNSIRQNKATCHFGSQPLRLLATAYSLTFPSATPQAPATEPADSPTPP
jgi:hypothetical protein